MTAAYASQHLINLLQMHVLAVVAGTEHGDMLGLKTKMRCPTALHEWQGLERLQGRAGKAPGVCVANMRKHYAVMVDDCNRSRMNDFSEWAARVFNKWFKRHKYGSMLMKTRLALSLAFIHGFGPWRRITLRLGGSFFDQQSLGVFLSLAKVHKGSAQRKADGCADRQKNNVRGFHKSTSMFRIEIAVANHSKNHSRELLA